MDIYSILNIKEEDFLNFPLLANRVADHQVEKVIDRNVSKLKRIEDLQFYNECANSEKQTFDDVLKKVLDSVNSEELSFDNYSLRDLRILSYNLLELQDDRISLNFALNLLDNRWKDSFIYGLIFNLTNNWNEVTDYFHASVSKLVRKKLEEYQGVLKRYIALKNHANFFDKGGPHRMFTLLVFKNIELFNAPHLIGYSTSSIRQSFYSDVIIEYIQKNNTNLDEIEEIFEKHNLDRTKKLTFCYLINKENSDSNSYNKVALCKLINRYIGDVTLAITWAPFKGATQDERDLLDKSKQIIKQWQVQQSIEVFFNMCVQDPIRREFWLQYVQYIDSFKIVGSTAIRRLLQSDANVGDLFERQFIETRSHVSQTAALVFFIRNKVVVEFSDSGALYAYESYRPIVKSIKDNRVPSLAYLKTPSMSSLIETIGYYNYWTHDEGKMVHSINWPMRLERWLKYRVLVSEDDE